MVKVSLKEFLRTGELGPIRLRMNVKEVLDTFGPPDIESLINADARTGPGGFLIYGDIHIGLDEEKEYVWSLTICIPNPGRPSGGDKISVNSWVLTSRTTDRDAAEALLEAGIEFKEDSWNGYPRCITTGPGVLILIDDKFPDGTPGLLGVIYFLQKRDMTHDQFLALSLEERANLSEKVNVRFVDLDANPVPPPPEALQ